MSQDLWELGFELFRDRQKMSAKFIQANIFDSTSDLDQLKGKMDIILVCQLLHLFDWEQQITATKKMVDFSEIESVLLGHQRGQARADTDSRPWGKMFLHDSKTFREMWHQVEVETGSQWDLEVNLVGLRVWMGG